MMNAVVKGIDECYVCGKSIEWEADMPVKMRDMYVRKLSEVRAEISAYGRDDNGTVTFEVLCRCPNCRISNKFYKKEKLRA